MAITRVNTSTINANSTAATAYSVAVGVAVAVGDLIVAICAGTGTHATNGMAVTATNNGSLTTLLEVVQGSSSTHWSQSFYKLATASMLSTDTLTFTPYVSSAVNTIVADIFRGTAGTINRAAVGSTNATSATPPTPALATAPTAGSLVLTMGSWSSGTGTPPTTPAYTAGSINTTSQSAAIGYILSADGSTTYGGNWAITSNTSAMQTVAFDAAAASTFLSAGPIIVNSRAVQRATNW
jgi:hypothetical protein